MVEVKPNMAKKFLKEAGATRVSYGAEKELAAVLTRIGEVLAAEAVRLAVFTKTTTVMEKHVAESSALRGFLRFSPELAASPGAGGKREGVAIALEFRRSLPSSLGSRAQPTPIAQPGKDVHTDAPRFGGLTSPSSSLGAGTPQVEAARQAKPTDRKGDTNE